MGHSDRENLYARFWKRVDKSAGERGCWIWTGSLREGRYGQIGYQYKVLLVHRLSYEIANGPIPDGGSIHHICQRPQCVNPNHLRLVNNQAEHLNLHKLNRYPNPKGKRKVTQAQVKDMKRLHEAGVSQYTLARQFGIHHTYVSKLIRGKMQASY